MFVKSFKNCDYDEIISQEYNNSQGDTDMDVQYDGGVDDAPLISKYNGKP